MRPMSAPPLARAPRVALPRLTLPRLTLPRLALLALLPAAHPGAAMAQGQPLGPDPAMVWEGPIDYAATADTLLQCGAASCNGLGGPNCTGRPDSTVTLDQLPSVKVVAIRFNGRSNPEVEKQKLAALQTWAKTKNLTTEGTPLVAYYDPPWTPGPFRRNEILLRLKAEPK